MLELTSVTKRFGPTTALSEASLQVEPGEFVAVLGPSGCGKTTALRVLAGFERPDSGSVTIAGREVAGSAWVPPERRRVGMVFQDYALFPHLDVAANVGFGLPRRDRGARVDEVLELVGLGGLGGRYPDQLSGGQQQRVALARALAPSPSVILLDEPWNAVDPLVRQSLRTEVAAILRRTGVTVLLVTHDREEAFSLADRVALMRDGAIAQVGRPEEIYFAPADRWCAEFVGAANVLEGRTAEAGVATSLGVFARNGNGHRSDVLVRPELLGLEVDGRGAGEVVERTFLGHDVLYRVRLADGTTVSSQRPSNEVVPLGARVRVRLHDGPIALLDR